MSRRKAVLVTGASGEMGTGLIHRLADRSDADLLGLDIRDLDPELSARCRETIRGDVLDQRLLDRLVSEFEIHTIFHLAALLSTRSEFTPETAHEVNVKGTLNLLKLAVEQSRWHGTPVKFLFPSSIAVYGIPDLETKTVVGKVRESDFNAPMTMYGCNKLYCEHLGRYYSDHYRQLSAEPEMAGVDFRSIRFPGLISAVTIPHGGTSDYAPEMIHAAAQSDVYACFVREDTQIPFLVMPDAIDALLMLMDAPKEDLSGQVYNVASFNPTALELADKVRHAFADAEISFVPDERRQRIVDSWPAQLDDQRARQDWGFAPKYDLDTGFEEVLVPAIRQRYAR
ncbi:MAG: NAD-dependent epimerase/dehydratase family protein [Myxococcota bacterium]